MSTGGPPARSPAARTQEYPIPRGLCRPCVRTLSRRLRDVPGVVSFEVDPAGGRLAISGEVDPAAVRAALADLSCS